jgi:hypothetical protein
MIALFLTLNCFLSELFNSLLNSHVSQIVKHFILQVIVFDVGIRIGELVVADEMLLDDQFIVKKVCPNVSLNPL